MLIYYYYTTLYINLWHSLPFLPHFSPTLLDASWMLTLHFFPHSSGCVLGNATLQFFPHSSGCVLDAYATFFPSLFWMRLGMLTLHFFSHSSGCVLGNATLHFFPHSSGCVLDAYATFFLQLFSHSSSCLRFNFFSTHKYINL